MKELVFKPILMTLGLVIITSCSNNETSVKVAEPENIEVNPSNSETQCPNCNGRGYNIRYKTIYEPEMNETRIVTGRIPSKKEVEVRVNCTLCNGTGKVTNQKSSSNFFEGATVVPAEPDKIGHDSYEKIQWATENLNVDRFRNGDIILEAKSEDEWNDAGFNEQPAWCYYDNNPANGVKYGKLYNWYAVNDPRALAPEGWHIPTEEEFKEFTDFLGVDVGMKMKSTSGWNSNGNGSNSSGFSGLPGGFRSISGSFYKIGEIGCWWSARWLSANSAGNMSLFDKGSNVLKSSDYKPMGFSVRCVKD